MHGPCEPPAVIGLFRFILVQRLTGLDRLEQPQPIRPVIRDEVEITAAIIGIIGIQRGCR